MCSGEDVSSIIAPLVAAELAAPDGDICAAQFRRQLDVTRGCELDECHSESQCGCVAFGCGGHWPAGTGSGELPRAFFDGVVCGVGTGGSNSQSGTTTGEGGGSSARSAEATRGGQSARSASVTGTGGDADRQGHVEGGVHPHEAPVDFEALYVEMEFFDDVKGGCLDKGKVIEARRLEMEYFHKHGCVLEGPKGRSQAAWGQGDHHEVDRHQ